MFPYGTKAEKTAKDAGEETGARPQFRVKLEFQRFHDYPDGKSNTSGGSAQLGFFGHFNLALTIKMAGGIRGIAFQDR